MKARRFIAIDIGNSDTKLSDGRRILRLKTGDLLDSKSTNKATSDLVSFCGRKSTTTLIGLSSVHPKAERVLRSLLRGHSVLALQTLMQTPSNPLVEVRTEGTGFDRILGCVAALSLYAAPLITIDFGTATTVNCVDTASRFVGGFILPGVDTQLHSLHQVTAVLPIVAKQGKVSIPGRTTDEAIRGGVILGTVGSVSHCVRLLEDKVGAPCTIVVSGGNARYVYKHVEKVMECSQVHDLVLLGILHLLKCYNKDVYGSDSPSRRSRRSTEGKDLTSTRARTQGRN